MFVTTLAIVITAVICLLTFSVASVANRAKAAEEALKLQVEENTRLLDIIAEAGITIRRRIPDDPKEAVREL